MRRRSWACPDEDRVRGGIKAVVITFGQRWLFPWQEREDLSGPAIADLLEQKRKQKPAVTSEVVPDEVELIAAALRRGAEAAELVVTTGGTGLAEQDVTPEATQAGVRTPDRGIGRANAFQEKDPGKRHWPRSAGAVCGTLGRTLIVNLPGRHAGPRTNSYGSILPLLPHAVDLLAGDTSHETGVHRATPTAKVE